MEKNDAIGYGLLGLVLAVLVVSVVWIANKDSTPTGAVAANSEMSSEGFSSNEEMMAAHHPEQQNSGMSSEGFSSYEEMMEAHHGGSAAQGESDGCGGIQGGASASKLVGKVSKYNIEYGDKGYQQLLDAADNIKVTSAQETAFVGLDIGMPCCGVTSLQAKDNCGCGHHVALFGLAKLLASQGVERAAIQEEIDNWKDVFYPGGVSGSTGACG